MKECENCGTEITFWMMQKQPTPFRYTCTACKSRYRIETPGMPVIVCVLVLVIVALALSLGFGAMYWGIKFALPYVLVIIGVGFCIEVWMQRYIARNGIFSLVEGSGDELVEDGLDAEVSSDEELPEVVAEDAIEVTDEKS